MPPSAPTPPTVGGASSTATTTRPGRYRRRRTVVVGLVSVLLVVLGAVLTDTGLAARSESRLSGSLLVSPRLIFAPEVTLGGFPFTTHADAGTFSSLVVTARGVPLPRAGSRACAATQCWAELGVTTATVRTADGWSIAPDARLDLSDMTAYAKLDSVNLGRLMGILDLSVNTPAPDDRAGGGGPGDGLLERTSGVVLTGTVALPPDAADASAVPPSAAGYAGPKLRVSVSVDLAVRGDALQLTATGFYTGPQEHAEGDAPASYAPAVLARFSGLVPFPRLPWGVVPTSANSAGSDVLISGSVAQRTVRVDRF